MSHAEMRAALKRWGDWCYSPEGLDGPIWEAALEGMPAWAFPDYEDETLSTDEETSLNLSALEDLLDTVSDGLGCTPYHDNGAIDRAEEALRAARAMVEAAQEVTP